MRDAPTQVFFFFFFFPHLLKSEVTLPVGGAACVKNVDGKYT